MSKMAGSSSRVPLERATSLPGSVPPVSEIAEGDLETEHEAAAAETAKPRSEAIVLTTFLARPSGSASDSIEPTAPTSPAPRPHFKQLVAAPSESGT